MHGVSMPLVPLKEYCSKLVKHEFKADKAVVKLKLD
jgi:hypothetical protein